ncbi:transposase [Gelidibacter pelagius]|uniref:Transposase n=1 Tax=Gelidibacter pelagius TaxID=2819985 RepID=A0ABS3SWD3_9FLAO|nr:transposase [Gelidibacter pelagius]MBO3100023.1 transposase [Gelidibacter pelagius]
MADKFNNKYRIPSARLQSWDYGNSGLYFITICTKNREHYFGDIRNGKMNLSEIGDIVKSEWIKTFDMRPDMNLEMDEYVVMPNHFHAIIGIGENRYNITGTDAMHRRDAMHCVSTNTGTNQFGPQSKNLASVIRGFKIGVTTNARKINPDFAWQSRFHDHIIRNDRALKNIQRYIINNPLQWKTGEFHD